MANVLNRETGIYLESVNTPDFVEGNWIINPDISAVIDVPKIYWFIEPDDTVREMTTEEKAAYDALHPLQINTGRLNDGSPAYLYNSSYIISVDSVMFRFSTRTSINGAKNFYINADQGMTHIMQRNALVTAATVNYGKPLEGTSRIIIKDPIETTILILELEANLKFKVFTNLAAPLLANTEMQCYYESDIPVNDPVISLKVNWTN